MNYNRNTTTTGSVSCFISNQPRDNRYEKSKVYLYLRIYYRTRESEIENAGFSEVHKYRTLYTNIKVCGNILLVKALNTGIIEQACF